MQLGVKFSCSLSALMPSVKVVRRGADPTASPQVGQLGAAARSPRCGATFTAVPRTQDLLMGKLGSSACGIRSVPHGENLVFHRVSLISDNINRSKITFSPDGRAAGTAICLHGFTDRFTGEERELMGRETLSLLRLERLVGCLPQIGPEPVATREGARGATDLSLGSQKSSSKTKSCGGFSIFH